MFITQPRNVADALSSHFIAIFNTACQAIILSSSVTSDTPPTAHAVPLKLQECVGGDEILSFKLRIFFIPSNLKAISDAFASLWACIPFGLSI
jgi:hypothetical protein